MSETVQIPHVAHRPFPQTPLTIGVLRRLLDDLEAQGAGVDDGLVVQQCTATVEFMISSPKCQLGCGHLPHRLDRARGSIGRCWCGCEDTRLGWE